MERELPLFVPAEGARGMGTICYLAEGFNEQGLLTTSFGVLPPQGTWPPTPQRHDMSS